MVRLINKKNIKQITNVAYQILNVQEKMTWMAEYNSPDVKPCIYATWHGNQFCVNGITDRKNTNILISNSIDGQIVANVAKKWGFKVCRGSSQRKGAVSGTLKMITKLKSGESIVITVDGPRGPLHKVKSGIIMLAREANVPIVPVHWYSPSFTFVKFPSWDNMRCPVGPCHILNIYDEPIYVGSKSNEEVAREIQSSLLNLESKEVEIYKEAKRLKLWEKV